MRLLLAEDETELSDAIKAILKHNNYSVDAVYNGRDALDYGEADNYDCIILDIMLPVMDGLEVLRRLREKGIDTPVIVLTAKSSVDDRISGLDSGADDYMTKPFSSGELLARIRAVTRRQGRYSPNTVSYGDIELNRETFELSCRGKTERLGSKEYQMLELLMRSGERLISTEQFMESVWGYNTEAEINNVWVYISYLRRRLSKLGSYVTIEAVRGRGYCLRGGS